MVTSKADKTNFAQREKVGQTEDVVIYKRYFSYWKMWQLMLLIVLNMSSEGLSQAYIRIISIVEEFDELFEYTGIVCALIILNVFIKYRLLFTNGQRISQRLHNQMMESLLYAPITYYDANPSGQIMNKLSSDLQLLDMDLNMTIGGILEGISFFAASIITLLILAPYFAGPAFFMILLYALILKYTQRLIIDTREVDLIERSPLFSFTKLTISGRLYVQVFQQSAKFN